MSVLAGVLPLHEPGCPERGRCRAGCIRDVEKLCGRVLERRGIGLGHPEYEDRLAFLLGECWIVARTYDPERDRCRNMGAWVFLKLGQRLVDAKRTEYRTVWRSKNYVYERPRPELVPLEPGMAEPLGAGSGDPATDSDADLTRIYAGGSWRTARDLELLGERAPRRVA